MTTPTDLLQDVDLATATSSEAANTTVAGVFAKDTSTNITTGDIMKRIYIVVAVVGLTGNAFVVATFGSFRKMRRKITNKYIINQSSIDFCASLFLLLGFTTVEDNRVESGGVGADLLCKFWFTKLFLWSLLVSSTWNLVILTVERYLEVVHPIWHKTHFSDKWAHVSLVMPWCIGIGFNVAYMLPTSKVQNGQCGVYAFWPSNTFRKVFGICIVLVQFLVPLFTLVFCYVKIALVLSKRIKVEPSEGQKSEAEKQKDQKWHRARRNTIKTLALVSVCFVVCWTWNQVYFLMFHLGHPEDYSSNFYHFTVFMVFLNSCVNPFIYGLKYQEFQQAFRRRFCGCSASCREEADGDFTSTAGGTAVSVVR